MTMLTKRFASAVALSLLATTLGLAQQEHQPRGKAETTIGGKKVVIEYGRPALKGRTLDELMKDLPQDRVWRACENQVTTLTTETALSIGGTKIPAGKYSLYVHAPAAGDWSLCVNKNLGIPLIQLWDKAPPNMANEPWPMLNGYQADKEVARIKMKKSAGQAGDIFSIAIKGDELTLSWADATWGTTIQAGS